MKKKNPISYQYIQWQKEKLKDQEYWKSFCEEVISQFRNKLANTPDLQKEMLERSITGAEQYGDSSLVDGFDTDQAIHEEVADICNYTMMGEFTKEKTPKR